MTYFLNKLYKIFSTGKISLSVQLFSVFILLTIILTIGLSLFVTHRANYIVQEEFNNKIAKVTSVFTELLIDDIIINDQIALGEDIEKIAKISTDLAQIIIRNNKGYQLINWRNKSRKAEFEYITTTQTLELSGQHYGSILFYWSTANSHREIQRRSRTVVVIVLLFFATVLAPVIFCMKYFVLRPIKSIEQRLSSFSEKNKTEFIPRKEWMALEFNNMEDVADSFATEIEARRHADIQFTLAKDDATEANKAKSQFLANMSHELRTPLNAIIGYSELLQDIAEEHQDLPSLADLKKIQSSGAHLLQLVNSVLDLSKVEAGKLELSYSDTDLHELINDVASTIKHILEKSRSRLSIKCEEGISSTCTDKLRLRQILYNLLCNAAKFTPNGLVTFHIYQRYHYGKSELIFSVADTGIGISNDKLPQLFEEFSQVGSGSAENYGGTGLGLSISQKLSKLMGGEITVSSRLGQGSEFTLTLPANTTFCEVTAKSA